MTDERDWGNYKMWTFWRFAWLHKNNHFRGALSFWKNDDEDIAYFKIKGRLYWGVKYNFERQQGANQ